MSTAGGIPRKWTVADSAEVYGVKYWGHNYFSIAESGNVQAHPAGPDGPAHRPEGAGRRGRAPRHRPAAADPLLRHPASSRIVELNEAFQQRDRRVRLQGPVQAASTRSRSTSTATSSRRSSSSAARTTTASRPAASPSCSRSWRCSRTTRRSSSATATRTRSTSRPRCSRRSWGATVILVVEKPSELDAHRRDRRARWASSPRIGIRAKLSPRGAGRWEASGGDRSKFGLSAARDGRGDRSFLRANEPARLASSCCTSTSAPDLAPSAPSRTRCARRAASTSSCASWARRSSTSTSAAAWASTTTARRPTSPRR